MYKICFYIPKEFAEKVKDAMFAEGAGKIGDYSGCCWQILGEGQFIPLEGSNSFMGEKNKLEKVPEYKIEMVCEDQYIKNAITALKAAHPYEEPAYQVIRLEDF